MDSPTTDLLLRIHPFAEDIGEDKAAGDNVAASLCAALSALADAVEIGNAKEISKCSDECSSLFLHWLSHKVCTCVSAGVDGTGGDPDDAQESYGA